MLVVAFLATAFFVNPIREVALQDDWAYALTVRHLLETGQYRPHDWISANMVAQAYWGALLAKILGYSFTSLRLSTVILLAGGLTAFYMLLRETGTRDIEAGLLTVSLLGNPLVLYLGFTFMTDAQFLSWLLIALWLYTRALRRHSHADMALGSVAGAAAIGTRQFGLALLVAMLITWLLDAERRRNAGLYVLGLVAPALITAWQSLTSLGFPTFFMTINGERQADYLRDPVFLLREAFWRPPVILEHLCLFLLPILPSAMLAARQCRPTASPSPAGWVSHGLWRRAGPPAVLILIGLYLAAGVCYVYLLPEVDRRQLLQSNDWSLQALRLPTAIPPPVVPLTTAGGLLSGWIFLRTTRETWGSRPSAGNRLVLLTGAGLLALDVLYFQFIDRYLIVLLPFALFFFARALRDWPRWCTLLAFSLALILLSLSCLVIRGYLEEEEARWTAAEALRIAGVEPRRVEAEWPWSAYYGAVDEWIADARGRNVRSYRDFFDRYLPQQRKAATYRLTLTTSRFERRRLIEGNVIFRDRLLQERTLFIVRLAEDARLAGS